MNVGDLLATPVERLGLSASFCRQCRQMDLKNLGEICLLNPDELIGRSGFTYQWLTELTIFLQERELLYLLQTTPGKIPG